MTAVSGLPTETSSIAFVRINTVCIWTTLPEILSRYAEAFPAVQLQLHESFTAHVIEGLLASDVDAGIVRDAEPVDGFVATPMLSQPFVAVLPAARVTPRACADDRPVVPSVAGANIPP